MALLQVTPRILIDEDELSFSFVTSSGPGGQNVNKTATCAVLTFPVATSPSLPEHVRARLIAREAGRIGQDGILTIKAQSFRSQLRNREDAISRLIEMIAQAAIIDKPRRPTRPTKGSVNRRITAKTVHSKIKSLRRRPSDD